MFHGTWAWAHDAADGWILALSWTPGFCAGHAQSPECRTQISPGLTLHGLWPEDGSGGASDFCGVSPEARAIDQAEDWCHLPQPAVSGPTAAALDAIMPGRASCLDRHEWLRHGTCSRLSAEAYFRQAVALATRVNNLEIVRTLAKHAGTALAPSELRESLAVDFGPEGIAAFTMICGQHDGTLDLLEIRVSLNPTGPKTFPASTAFPKVAFPAAHACPADAPIFIDGAR